MRGPKAGDSVGIQKSNYLLILVGLLGACLAVLFYEGFEPHQILFANDGPLGAWVSESNRFPGRLFGRWLTTEWLGLQAPSAAPSLTNFLSFILPAVLYFKTYGPLTLLFLGFCAWVFFRQLGFHPMVCVLGGLAAGLNMHFFSTACWGLGGWNVAAAMTFLALAALSSKSIQQTWAKAILAGLAVGMGLMEGFDVGAILSVYVGVFVIFRALSEENGLAGKALTAVLTEVLVVFFAGFIAAHTISSLVGTQIEGVVSAQQNTETKERQWDRDTQWSLPKMETLRLIMPGVFGYRLQAYITTQDKSGSYWGLVGEDPRYAALKSDDTRVRAQVISQFNPPLREDEITQMQSDDPQTRANAVSAIRLRLGMFMRHDGTGEYAGVLVALLAVFALVNSGRGASGPFTPRERRLVWFWGVAALVSVLTAWGRHGFIYGLLYRLPYFSTIRNPIKFLHPFHIVWLILAGYGLEALHRRYLQNNVKRADFLPDHLASWWKKATGFEKKWTVGTVIFLLAILGTLGVFVWQKAGVIAYLVDHGFKVELAEKIAGFSIEEGAWFAGFLLLSIWGITNILSGAWSGPRARWAWIYLGVVLFLDLGRADRPWVHFYDYQEKYSPNLVEDFLLEKKPYESRVMGRLSPRGPGSANGPGFGSLYDFWMQNDFPYHDIQNLDFAQMPRMPVMDDAYLRNFQLSGTNIKTTDLRPAARLWELTDTRYLLLDTEGVALLNEHGDPARKGFRILAQLHLRYKDGITAPEDPGDLTVENVTSGPTSLIEYTHALPRAKLYAHWQTPASDPATLAMLLSTNFDPASTVLLATNTPLAQPSGDPGADAGTVDITDYHPKDIKLEANAKTPAILLFNDKYAPDWRVSVDQKPASLLRCNYIMRGVFLSPGQHNIEFRFKPSVKPLYVSLAGWAAGILLAGYLAVNRKKK